MNDWLQISRGDAPLVVSFPHTGTDIPVDVEARLVSPWVGRLDADWCVDQLYGFATELGATTVRTAISRTVIDVNRDPSGASLYPGQATTELCPTTTFDGAPLYRNGAAPNADDIAMRRAAFFDPYHTALSSELARLRAKHGSVVLYDAHSIRSHVPRLFEGELPLFNIGTNGGATCASALRGAMTQVARDSGESYVVDGRFRGGWTTRHYGQPAHGIHAVQMELAQRGYMREPAELTPDTWPSPLDAARADRLRPHLRNFLSACIAFAYTQGQSA